MKRLLLGLIVASGLALMAAPQANAANALCGASWAVLGEGAAGDSIQATGASDQPGWVTTAVLVGEITFDALGTNGANGCTVHSGEMILNMGDIQTSPAGVYGGPTDCYDSDSLLTTGLPCFDGNNDLSPGGTLTSPGAEGAGSEDLVFTAIFNWFDTHIVTVDIPFAMTLQPAGTTTVAGITKAASGAPVLQITMQKIGTVPVATIYGAAPYLGDLAVSCEANGANTTDLVANGNGPGAPDPTIAGGFESVLGAVEIFSTGQAGGSIGFNANDDITASGATATPGNNDCSITIFPGTADPGYSSGSEGLTQSQWPDGTSNSFALIDEPNSGTNCSDANTAGAGYANDSVAWGSKDTNAYLTTVGLASGATGYVPPGGMGTCTTYLQSGAAGKLTGSLTATQALTSNGIPATPKLVTATSTTPSDCQVSTAMASASDSFCSLSLTAGATDVIPDSSPAKTTTGTINCSCVKLDSQCTAAGVPDSCCTGAGKGTCTADHVSSSVTLSSTNCPVASGAGPEPVTCTQ